MASKKLAKADPYERFNPYIGKKFMVSFGKHTTEDPAVLQSVGKKTVTGFKLAPPKREIDGKMKSPELYSLVFDQFEIVFIADKSVPVTTMEGIQITIGPTTVLCKMVD